MNRSKEINANSELKDLGRMMAEADTILLFPHIDPDPDAVGSCMALCMAMRQQGKACWVLMDGPMPSYMRFLIDRTSAEVRADGETPADPDRDPRGLTVTTNPQILGEEPDLCVLVDCSEKNRIEGREECFARGRTSLCIDHHHVIECFCDHYYIDPDAAATAQLIYHLFREMDWPLDARIAEALYTGINGDTGCFMHSNTTAEVHRIAADLMEYGVDANRINISLHQSRSPKDLAVHAKAIENMEFLAGGKVVVSRLSREDFEACGATVENAENVIDELRSIEGVEIAVILKQDGDVVRGSMRAKTRGNVARIAELFGGGGHIKAAGFRQRRSMDEVYEDLRERLLMVLK